MKKPMQRILSVLLTAALLFSTVPAVIASASETDPEGGSFAEACGLQLAGSDLKANYSGTFSEGDSADYFTIQAPDNDCTMCFSLQLDTSVLPIGDSSWHDGRTVKAYTICVYDSEFHQIGYAYKGISYTWIEKLPGTSLYHTVQDNSVATIAVPVERNKTYFIEAKRTDYYIYPTAFRYSLDVLCGPKMVMDSPPFQTTYLVGDKLNMSGLCLSLCYPDGTVEKLSSGYEIYSEFGTEKAGRQTVNISYVHKIEDTYLTFTFRESFLIDVLETKTTSGKCGDNLKWALDTSSGLLHISGTGAMTDYRSSYSVPWYFDQSSINAVAVESGATSIGDYAFYACINLSSVIIPDSVTRIGNNAFADCSFADITIPDSLTSIGDSAFMFCGAFTDLTIPDGVTHIGDGAFSFCENLTSVTIPDSVMHLGQGAFRPCPCLTTITVDERNANYSSDEYGVLYNQDKTTLIQYPSGNMSTDFTVPDSVSAIDDRAFCYADHLESVMIPNGMTTIGTSAFESCWHLSSIHIPSSVTAIGENAFSYCDNLAYICSDTKNCYAKTYAEENGIAFRLCDGHGLSCAHEYTSAVTTAPTCTADGVRTFTCTLCGKSYTEVIPATGHSYDAVVTTQPTCTAAGVTTYTCSVCGSSYTEAIAKKPHTPQAVNEPATCQATGRQYTKCAVCGETLSDVTVLPKTDHTYNAVVTTQPTCAAAGVATYTCSVCGHSYTEPIAKKPHTPQVVTEPATCQATGKQYTKCAVCGETLSDVTVLPKTDHTYNAVVTKQPTCTAAGVTTYTCSVCGSSYTEAVAKKPHTPQTVTEPATCQATGKQYTKCAVCGETLSVITVLPKTNHTYNAVVTTQPTCTAAGVTTYTCSVCGSSYTEAIAKKPHTPQTVTEPATCQATGKQYTKCAVCGETLSDVTVLPKSDHTPAAAVKENMTSATCTAPGSYDDVVRCAVCRAEITRRTVGTAALGHSFTNYVYNNDATTEKDGTKTAKCDRCDATDTIPAPGTKIQPSTIAIRNYSPTKTVDYRATITFTADVTNPVAGAAVHWFMDGKDAGTDDSFTLTEMKQDCNVQARYMKDGKVLAESAIETVKVNSGFFARLIAFFRGLFGRLPVMTQEYLGIEIIDRVLP